MAREEPKVNIRLPQELKDKLHALAAKNKRSVNAEMVAAIERAVAGLGSDAEIERLKREREDVAQEVLRRGVLENVEDLDGKLKRLDDIAKRLEDMLGNK